MENQTFLQTRKTGIGGSDIAAILGVSKFKTALDVFLSKTTDQPEQQGEHLYWGHALENPIIDRFVQDTGALVIRQPETRQHPDYEWAIANADALIMNGDTIEAILEIKTSSAFKSREWGADDTDEVPIEYIAQVQWYMWIYDVQEAYLAALIAGMICGALAATAAAGNAEEQPAQKTTIIRRTAEVADCGNITQMQAKYGADEAFKYALQRVKDDCEADRQAALLAQTWETDPMAGVVHE